MLHAFVLAAAAAAQPVAAAQAPAKEGVISYPPAFFADARPVVVLDMVNRLPGFSFDGGDSGVRGLGGAGGNVLIDGQRPASKGDSLEEILRRMPASQVERIDLIRGGAPGVDMQGKPVVANIVRKGGDSWRGLVVFANRWVVDDGRLQPGLRVEGSRTFDGKVWEGSIVGGGGIDDGAGDGPRIRRDADGNILLQGDVKSEGDAWNVTANTSYETPLRGGKMRANARFFYNAYQFDQTDYLAAPASRREIEDFRETIAEGETGLRYSHPLGTKSSVETFAIQRLRRAHVTAEYDVPGLAVDFATLARTGESVGRVVLKHSLTPSIDLEGGAEGAFNFLKGSTLYAENGVAFDLPAANVRVEETRGEAFATATWRATPKLSLEAGLRAEASTISSEGDIALEKTLYYLKPRGLLTWSPTDTTQVRLRVERNIGQLSFGDFVATGSSLSSGGVQAGNPDLDPQQAWEVEATFEKRFWDKGAIVLSASHAELDDVVDRVPIFTLDGDVFDAPGNIGKGTNDVLSADLTVPLDRLGVKGGLLRGVSYWSHSEVADPTTGEKRRISSQKPVDWRINFSQDLPQWRFNWGVDIYGQFRQTSYRFADVEITKLQSFVLPYMEYKPRPDIAVRLEIPNATSRPLKRYRQIYAGPRNTSGLSYVDEIVYDAGPMVYLRVRKTLGG